MDIQISGRHFKVTPALKEYMTQKLEKLDKYALKLESVQVILDVQKIHQICEIVAKGKNLRLTACEKKSDMYAAFDLCLDNVQLQMSRQHDKVKDHKGRRYAIAGKPPRGAKK